MGCFRLGAASGAVLLVALAGCSTSEAGSPTAVEGSVKVTTSDTIPVPPPSTGTTPTTSKPPVARPKSIDISGTDGCKIMAQLPNDFGIQGKKPIQQPSGSFPKATDCVVAAPEVNLTLGIATVTNVDAEEFASTANGSVTKVTVAGFPAFTLTLPGYSSCFAGVNVSDGQMLYLQWRYSKVENVPSPAQLCENAQRVATAAMKVLGAS